MNILRSIARNLNLILRRDLAALLGEVEARSTNRVDDFEKAVDERLAQADAQVAGQLAESIAETDRRIEALTAELHQMLAERAAAAGARIDERLGANDRQIDERMGVVDHRVDARLESIEISNDRRFEEIVRALGERAGNYESAVDRRVEERSAQLDSHLSRQFSDHARAVDIRLDDRQVGMDRRIDDRFNAIEKRIDERFEMHERRTDASLENNRVDIVDRTDLLLQVLEQRLDRQRRELRALREATMPQGGAPTGSEADPASGHLTLAAPDTAASTESPIEQQSPEDQIESFRKLADKHGSSSVRSGIPRDPTIYQQILDWKRVSGEGINDFTRDEQEIVDYILSFLSDPDEIAYTRQHLRRFLGTMQRIPPPQRTTDRLLELGSLLHLTPAIKKFCGYQTIVGADLWESEERVAEETIEQAGGGDRLTIPLHNFNAEADPFPFPDKHFRVVLCCELLEHLQHDPMHMLWEINRVLEDAGYLLLTTPNIASARSIEGVLIGCTPYLMSQYNTETPIDQHHREYAPFEVGVALAAAGFRVLQLETEDVWLRSNPAILKLLSEINLPTNLRGDNIFALAIKVSPPVERRPRELYID